MPFLHSAERTKELLPLWEEKGTSVGVGDAFWEDAGGEVEVVEGVHLSGFSDGMTVWEPAWVSVSLASSSSGLLLAKVGVDRSDTGVGTEISMISSLAPDPRTSEELLESDLTINLWCCTGEGSGDLDEGEEGEEGEGGGGLGEVGRNLLGSSGGVSILGGVSGLEDSEGH